MPPRQAPSVKVLQGRLQAGDPRRRLGPERSPRGPARARPTACAHAGHGSIAATQRPNWRPSVAGVTHNNSELLAARSNSSASSSVARPPRSPALPTVGVSEHSRGSALRPSSTVPRARLVDVNSCRSASTSVALSRRDVARRSMTRVCEGDVVAVLLLPIPRGPVSSCVRPLATLQRPDRSARARQQPCP